LEPPIIGLIGILVVLALLSIGVPVAFGMAVVGFAGFWYLVSLTSAFSKLAIVPFAIASNYNFIVLPLFILMAHVVSTAGLAEDLYKLAAKWLGHQPGGIAMATIGGCAGFAAVSGDSMASVSTMGLVAFPEMQRYKYDTKLATGCIAAGGTLGILIPPSFIMIIYAVLTETSIGKLFIAGIVPGVLLTIFFMVIIMILCRRDPSLGPRGAASSFKEKVVAFGSCFEIISLIILILGGLIIGWFSPSEAGAVGAFGAIVFASARKRLTWQKLKKACLRTMVTTGMIYGIMIGAFILAYFIAVSELPFRLADMVVALNLPPLVIMAFIIVVYIILGCLMDTAAMIMLTIPIFFPIVLELGFDPIWFGIIVVIVVEMALITPPMGVNVWILAGVVKDVPMLTIFRGIIPFCVADICLVILVLFIPQIVLFLPNMM